MNKEEILALSREENKGRDEMERDAYTKAGQLAVGMGGLVCMVIIMLEGMVKKTVNMGTWAVWMTMSSTMLLCKYARLKKKHELVFGLIEAVLAVFFLTLHILSILGINYG